MIDMMTLMRHLDGLNLYAFCAMNPVTYVDPSGYAGTPKCGTGSESGSGAKISLSKNDDQLKHIFREGNGHIIDTPENRSKIMN